MEVDTPAVAIEQGLLYLLMFEDHIVTLVYSPCRSL